ncbi:YpiB family protein [Alicyclobacillus sp. ALC3]|uniref:YpiB family protein n=1 Tax=Alicyclobacillus sp. ALC3 TaxID=2796143 RepID=UPI002379BADF|nr:YpiB family protein [Alicyclobacillus sp. ALC3]WDL97213.1 YpiB family protein [Alicyclobacillus sp. ALC3]
MGSTVTVAEKKHFLRWFLANYQLQSREAEMLIRYMMTRENVLRRVHFVENFRQLSRVIVVSTSCVSVAPFRYYRRNKPVSTDVEQAFLDLYQHPDEEVYVGLFFKDRANCNPYASVIEELGSSELEPAMKEMVALQADWIIEQSLRTYQRLKLMELVNAALDAGDREAFYHASRQLIEFDEVAESPVSTAS